MDFKRREGFIGKIPREWIERNLPKCPFCKEPALWEFALEKREKDSTFERVFGQIPQKWYKAYHFRCPKCNAILEVPADAIMKMPIMSDGSLFPGILKLVKQYEYKKDEKPWDGNVLIESVGTISDLQNVAGTRVLLKTLQEWSSSKIQG